MVNVRTQLLTSLVLIALTPIDAKAQPAPSGTHPRIWLDAATIAGIRANANVANGAVSRGATRCAAARNSPSDYATGGWQGFEFVSTLSGCLASWEASGNTDDLATAIKYWNVLLDDYQNVGDGAGGDDVVTHDTGYAMRTFAPFAALAYDWLHDAPGVTEDLRSHARERFDAWATFYEAQGYLRDLTGANYQAGYLFATTLMSIADGGEGGSSSDAHWATVRDTIWGKDMKGGLVPGGILNGGDWAEGWQYGELSVLEYALAARAVQDNGVTVPGIGAWTNSLVARYAHDLTPAARQVYAAGDTESTTPYMAPTNEALLATIAGPSDSTQQAWARSLNDELGLTNDNALFDALAAARSGPSTPMPASAPTAYLSPGIGNWYVRGDWTKNAGWAVFQCTHRLVADHEHNDAGNWVLTRGADDLVVDPSPYGSLSTLTGNAPAVDSAVLPSGYSPSQAGWGQTTSLVWAKQSVSGVGVARCDYADQFRKEDIPSDVSHAVRDFVVVPNGDVSTVVLLDRVVTGDSSRGLHFRVRTPTTLSLDNNSATATVGASSLSIRTLWSSGGTANVRDMPLSPDCSSDAPGQCDISRLPAGQEYRVDVPGPTPGAIHVMEAQATGQPALNDVLLSGAGYRGVLLNRASGSIAVVGNDGTDGAAGTSLAYRVPAGSGATHVVVDAPVDSNGESDVTAALDGSDCAVKVVPHSGSSGGFDGRGLIVRLTSSCAVSEDAAAPPLDAGTVPAAGGSTSGFSSGGSASMPVASSAGGTGGTSGTSGSSPVPSSSGGQPASGSGGDTSVAPGDAGTGFVGGSPGKGVTCSMAGSDARSPVSEFAGLLVGVATVLFRRRARR